MVILSQMPILSRAFLYALLALMGFFSIIIFYWQIMVLKGRSMANADGSKDDWHIQQAFYGIALADVFLACPATFAGLILVFAGSRWGFYILALVASWFLWANTMTTANSLRFEQPKLTLYWLFEFPLGVLVGAGYIAWSIVHFDAIFSIY